eukprot:TRINITY_DN7302_c0_g3_i1.p1 TRINITY_DN7302_c0_g3~~TRINITY_DN7302_c0_g3_i1.p1  ORF type:complete len:1009 (-),score=368.28 TRINITY_DN7302_c0_g3_i1:56-3049(-)
METIVTGVLRKYFETFIKDFQKDQLKIQTLQGKGQLSDLELNEPVIQELLFIPTNFLITKAFCKKLELKLPKVTKLKKHAIKLEIEEILLNLEEPDEIPPMPNVLSDLLSGKKKTGGNEEGKSGGDIVKNMSYNIKKLRMEIKTKGIDAPLTVVEIKDIQADTTNSNWEIIEDCLSARKVDLPNNTETMYKLGKIGSVTVYIQRGETKVVILDGMPTEVKVEAIMNNTTGSLIKTNMDIFFKDIHLAWNKTTLTTFFDTIKYYRKCFDRPMPKREGEEEKEKEKEKEKKEPEDQMIYGIHVGDLSVKFLESENKSLLFGGKGFSFFTSPRSKILQKEEKFPNQLVGAFKAFTRISLNSFEVSEFPLDTRKDPQHQKLVFHDELTNKERGNALFVLELRSYWPDLNSGKQVDLLVNTNKLQFNLDRPVWHRFLHYVNLSEISDSEEPIPTPNLKTESTLKAIEELENFSFAKLYDSSTVNIEINDTSISVPTDFESELYQNNSLCFTISSITVQNKPGWKATPHLPSGINLLPDSKFKDQIKNTSLPSRNFEVSIGGVHCLLFEKAEKKTLTKMIIEPTTFSIYGRSLIASTIPYVEVVINTTQFNLSLAQKELNYIKYALNRNTEWLKQETILLRPTNVEKIEENLKSVLKETAHEIEKKSETISKIASNLRNEEYSELVSMSLKAFNTASFIKIDKGSAKLPLNWTDDKDENGEPLSSLLEFTGFKIVMENHLESQSFLLDLKSIEATGLDHPKLPTQLQLAPLRKDSHPIFEDFEGNSALRFIFTRKPVIKEKVNNDSNIKLGLSNMRIVSKAKKDMDLNASMMSDVKDYAMEVMKSFSTQEDVQEKAKENVDKVSDAIDFLNLHWTFSLGECEFVQFDSSIKDTSQQSNHLARGQVRLSHVDQNSLVNKFNDMEQQLIESKMKSVGIESDKQDLIEQIRLLKQQVNKKDEEFKNLQKDFESVNNKLVEIRLKNMEGETTPTKKKSTWGFGKNNN